MSPFELGREFGESLLQVRTPAFNHLGMIGPHRCAGRGSRNDDQASLATSRERPSRPKARR